MRRFLVTFVGIVLILPSIVLAATYQPAPGVSCTQQIKQDKQYGLCVGPLMGTLLGQDPVSDSCILGCLQRAQGVMLQYKPQTGVNSDPVFYCYGGKIEATCDGAGETKITIPASVPPNTSPATKGPLQGPPVPPGTSDKVCQPCRNDNPDCVSPTGSSGSLVCAGLDQDHPEKAGYCQYADANKIALCNPLKSKTLGDLIGTIENFIFNVAIVLTPILILYAGFLFLTAAGNPAKVTQARGILIWTVVGLAVILLSKGITAIIQGILGI